jgi:adenosylhomocysteine nucleosidase
MLAIVAALPREISGLVKGTRAVPALRSSGLHLYRLPEAVAVAGGMGSERAMAAVAAALRHGPCDTLLSVGLAGACLPEAVPGRMMEAGTVVDTRTGERFETDAPAASVPRIVLATSSTIASVKEKARLGASYGAAMVDMEAATVARLARAHGLRFRALKAISDAHDYELASLARFEGKNGSFRTGRFALHTALRPHHWSKAMTLGRHSGQALAALQAELRRLLEAGA